MEKTSKTDPVSPFFGLFLVHQNGPFLWSSPDIRAMILSSHAEATDLQLNIENVMVMSKEIKKIKVHHLPPAHEQCHTFNATFTERVKTMTS